MTDPYNSAGPYAPPAARPDPVLTASAKPDPIAGLDVSESWKRKFRLIEKAGGPKLPGFRNLRPGERLRVNFNILGFLFGPIYFLIKGLWRQSVVYLICAVTLIVLFEVMGLGELARAMGYGFAALYAVRANVSYYRKVVLGETTWL
ncbi:DUF2628 domain-containing protein [Luteimonas sp. 3794]|uniref:DUF2628 domain-containing protein n=1 Tax=Luteimonas sp. 3794 TaxID=2817730 RepID=UPI002863C149|nr:DUF2628 domain-containing protein [Luteimonas sp. 3794]MDR6992722.1 hypothetical protein [Luteimonas sp. 3794]